MNEGDKAPCGIRDRRAEYAAAGATVIGVSPDEPPALRKFADKHFPKVSPKTHDDVVLEALGELGAAA